MPSSRALWGLVTCATLTVGCSESPSSAGAGGGNNGTGTGVDQKALESVSGVISADKGGSLAFADGTGIDIPPGALARDTEITLARPTQPGALTPEALLAAVRLTPEGLSLSEPAKLTLHYSKAPDESEYALAVVSQSNANEVMQVPGEQAAYAAHDFTHDPAAKTAVVMIDHFSWWTVNPVPKLHLAWELPGKYLRNGDILFALTDGLNFSQAKWLPMHTGMYIGDPSNDKVIESTVPTEDCNVSYGSGVQKRPYHGALQGSKAAPSGLDGFTELCGTHLFMGARQPPGDITDAMRQQVVSYATSHIGDAYGALWVGNSVLGTSCAELVEESWEAAGVNITSLPDEMLAPHDQFLRTSNVITIKATVGSEIRIPLVGMAYTDSNEYQRGVLGKAPNGYVEMTLDVTAEPDVFAAGRARLEDSARQDTVYTPPRPLALKELVFTPTKADLAETVEFKFELAAPAQGLAFKSPRALFVEVEDPLKCRSVLSTDHAFDFFGFDGTASGATGGTKFGPYPAQPQILVGEDPSKARFNVTFYDPDDSSSDIGYFSCAGLFGDWDAFAAGTSANIATDQDGYCDFYCADPVSGELESVQGTGSLSYQFSPDCKGVQIGINLSGKFPSGSACTMTASFQGSFSYGY